MELPGIETGVQPRLTSENNGCDDLRQRETTRRAVRIYPSVLMASTAIAGQRTFVREQTYSPRLSVLVPTSSVGYGGRCSPIARRTIRAHLRRSDVAEELEPYPVLLAE